MKYIIPSVFVLAACGGFKTEGAGSAGVGTGGSSYTASSAGGTGDEAAAVGVTTAAISSGATSPTTATSTAMSSSTGASSSSSGGSSYFPDAKSATAFYCQDNTPKDNVADCDMAHGACQCAPSSSVLCPSKACGAGYPWCCWLKNGGSNCSAGIYINGQQAYYIGGYGKPGDPGDGAWGSLCMKEPK